MTNKESVYEKTYENYLAQVGETDFNSVKQKLGVEVEKNKIIIPLFGKSYEISAAGISDTGGKQPMFDICVILCKYILLCPQISPKEKDWVSFRDLKDSGPLTSYFVNDVERAIATQFNGKLGDMKNAGRIVKGYSPDIEVSYDLSMQFDALPRVPIVMLFNDADDEFFATCSVLFERRAESYLDPECLAMVGRCLFADLKKAVQ
ncbi:MAG: DUF3786 domain-containing protein [Thermodesulfobacteriota bacterium]|nr:DUF3786 domain-containing protein [Thermodesulfobacteriota bacterium]